MAYLDAPPPPPSIRTYRIQIERYSEHCLIAGCIYRLVMISINLSNTAHFGHHLCRRNCNPNYNYGIW